MRKERPKENWIKNKLFSLGERWIFYYYEKRIAQFDKTEYHEKINNYWYNRYVQSLDRLCTEIKKREEEIIHSKASYHGF